MNCRPRPCAECPWRKDTPPGQFPAERYEALRSTSRTPAGHPGMHDPMFACHKSAEGNEIPCAGWLAVEGADHVRIRIGVSLGEIPVEALQPGDDWPELYEDYASMAEAQGRRPPA